MEKFKKGDWCFCEFTLQQITGTEEGRITSVSDGNFNMYSYDLSDRCFPLDSTIKGCSDTAAYWSKRFHELKCNGLNHPDLKSELVNRWVAMCESVGNYDKLRKLYNGLDEFGNDVVKKVNELRSEEVGGVPLFRR